MDDSIVYDGMDAQGFERFLERAPGWRWQILFCSVIHFVRR